MVYMGGIGELKVNELLRYIIENSLITPPQLEIIYNRKAGIPRSGTRSRGAYYRVLKQSRAKVRGVLYSFLLMEVLGLIDEQGKELLVRLAKQLVVTKDSDIDESTARDVIRVMEQLIRRLSNF